MPRALTVLSGNPLRSDLLASGAYSVQDVGSQVLPLLLPPGELLVDLAAAPGGKSMSALAHGRARRAIALDVSPARLRRVSENARRLGLRGLAAVAADVSRPAAGGEAVRPRSPRRAVQRHGNPAQEPGDPLPRHAGGDRAARAIAGGVARVGVATARPRRPAALRDLQPRGGGERAGRRAGPRRRSVTGARSDRTARGRARDPDRGRPLPDPPRRPSDGFTAHLMRRRA